MTNSQSPAKGVKLQRELGLFSAINLIVSVMIGSGIFVSPSSALKYAGSVYASLCIWAACGFLSLLGALAYAELGTVVGKSGAEYAFYQAAFTPLHKFWGPLPSFINAWISVLFVRPAEVAVIILTFSEYFVTMIMNIYEYFAGATIDAALKPHLIKLVALLALGVITFINFMSVKLYVKIQNLFSSLKVFASMVIVVGGLYYLFQGKTEHLEKGFEGSTLTPNNIVIAIFNGLWAYDGWSSVTVVAEEIKRPGVNIPRSILIGVPLVTGLYVFMNLSYMSVLSIDEMKGSAAVAVLFSEKVLGPFQFIVPLGVVLATFGCALSVQFGITRLCYAAGREGHMLQAFSFVHVKRLTPAPAVLLQGFLTCFCILAGNIYSLLEFASFLCWIFYGMAMAALILLRYTKPDVPRPYKVPLVIPIFVLILSIVLFITPIVYDPKPQFLNAIVFIGLGILVYIPFVYYKYRMPYLENITYLIQVLLKVVPPEETDQDSLGDTESRGTAASPSKHSMGKLTNGSAENSTLLQTQSNGGVTIVPASESVYHVVVKTPSPRF
uniref:b(0,+)-type amino acid transporter 1 n=2 Tax=Cacopsylla melanoneura TaxID=428564 RepID=A0A8D8XDK1_9HEMI